MEVEVNGGGCEWRCVEVEVSGGGGEWRWRCVEVEVSGGGGEWRWRRKLSRQSVYSIFHLQLQRLTTSCSLQSMSDLLSQRL
ncbi:hypothetical protein M8J77_001098 [Diaphorina citri]|nr:hypothetical protein M8J77_001098 [Diaphorina citri]